MAFPDQKEVPALRLGMQCSSAELGAFLQNVYPWLGALRVRPGLGQMGQWDSTLRNPVSQMDDDAGTKAVSGTIGYTRLLGQHVFVTDFGHRQIVSLWLFAGYTGTSKLRGKWGTFYSLNVYDETTGRRWEEVLFRHTSDNNTELTSPQDWRGHYETLAFEGVDSASWASGQDVKVGFCQYRDKLLFASPMLGLWCYAPADFDAARPMTTDGISYRHNAETYSESSRVFQVVASNGLFADGYAYLDNGGFPRPVDVCPLGSRVAMANSTTRDVFFTDPGMPGSIIAGVSASGPHAIFVPTERDLSAILDIFGNLMVWTAAETWAYRPNIGGQTVNGGDLIRLSDSIGCIGPQARCKAGEAVCWADARGVYRTTGEFNIEVLSSPIDRLFKESMPNPLQHFFSTLVSTYDGVDAAHLRMQYEWTDPADVVLAYDGLRDLLFVTDPKQRVSFVCKVADKAWSVWSFESMVLQPTVTTPPVGAPVTTSRAGKTANIDNPVLLAIDGDVYLLGGVESQTIGDNALDGGGLDEERGEDHTVRSFYLLKWGRGGGVDRSVEAQEDNRAFTGWYWIGDDGNPLLESPNFILFDQPIPVPPGYVCPQGTVMLNGGVLVPVRISPDEAFAQPDRIVIGCQFDNVHWQPICEGNNAKIDAIVPPERQGSSEGWRILGAPLVGSECQVYLGGAPDPAGNDLHLLWDGANANPFDNQPNMQLPDRGIATLLYLPFERKQVGGAYETTASMGFSCYSAFMAKAIAEQELRFIEWRGADVIEKHADDDVAQAVDWVFKTAQAGLDGNVLVKLRNIWTSLVSHGKATTPIPSVPATWLWGLFNTVTSSDWKDWASQIADFNNFENVDQTKVPLRLRLRNSLGEMSRLVWNGAHVGPPAGPDPVWGESGTPATGNVLVADDPVDTVAISDAVKGESVSAMLFGHVTNRAESLTMRAVTIGLRVAGLRRRRGR